MNVVPTLNPNGWVTDPIYGMSEVLAMYFSNKHSQSDLFEVRSVAFDLARHPDDPTGLTTSVKDSLSEMYSAYFPERVEVEVTTALVEKPYRNYKLSVSVNCVVEGKTYSLAETYQKYEGGFKRILEKE